KPRHHRAADATAGNPAELDCKPLTSIPPRGTLLPGMGSGRRILIGNVIAFTIAVSAVLTQGDGPLDWAGICVRNEPCKTKVRVGVIVAGFFFKFVFDFFESTFPLLRLDKFRGKYLDSHLKPVWEDLKKTLRTKNIRLNIMVPRWTMRGQFF